MSSLAASERKDLTPCAKLGSCTCAGSLVPSGIGLPSCSRCTDLYTFSARASMCRPIADCAPCGSTSGTCAGRGSTRHGRQWRRRRWLRQPHVLGCLALGAEYLVHRALLVPFGHALLLIVDLRGRDGQREEDGGV